MDDILKRNYYDWLLEALALVCLISILSSFYFYFCFTEDKLIPMHFNAQGNVDRWGKPYNMLFFVLISIIVYIALCLTEKGYKKFNYPFQITSSNSRYFYRIAVRFIRHLKTWTMSLFAYLNITVLLISFEKTESLNMIILGIYVCFIFIMLLCYLFKMYSIKNRYV